MSEEFSLDKTSELFEILPFMEAFPFEEYQIVLQAEGQDPSEFGISQILISTIGTFGVDTCLNFFYKRGEESVIISFHIEDIQDIVEQSSRITKLNNVVEELNNGILSSDISIKLDEVKRSKKFINSIGLENISNPPFSDILQEIQNLNGLRLRSELWLGAISLNKKRLKLHDLSKDELITLSTYFDFHLHYAKILLGIVIAAKIY
jgi:hypothetical protein